MNSYQRIYLHVYCAMSISVTFTLLFIKYLVCLKHQNSSYLFMEILKCVFRCNNILGNCNICSRLGLRSLVWFHLRKLHCKGIRARFLRANLVENFRNLSWPSTPISGPCSYFFIDVLKPYLDCSKSHFYCCNFAFFFSIFYLSQDGQKVH